MNINTLLGIGAIGGAIYLATNKKAQAKVKKSTGLSDRNKKLNEQENKRYIKELKRNSNRKNQEMKWNDKLKKGKKLDRIKDK